MSDSNNGMYSKILVKAATCSKQKCNSPTREGRAEGSTGDTEAVVGAVVMTGKQWTVRIESLMKKEQRGIKYIEITINKEKEYTF